MQNNLEGGGLMGHVCPGCGIKLTSNDMPYKDNCPYCQARITCPECGTYWDGRHFTHFMGPANCPKCSTQLEEL